MPLASRVVAGVGIVEVVDRHALRDFRVSARFHALSTKGFAGVVTTTTPWSESAHRRHHDVSRRLLDETGRATCDSANRHAVCPSRSLPASSPVTASALSPCASARGHQEDGGPLLQREVDRRIRDRLARQRLADDAGAEDVVISCWSAAGSGSTLSAHTGWPRLTARTVAKTSVRMASSSWPEGPDNRTLVARQE